MSARPEPDTSFSIADRILVATGLVLLCGFTIPFLAGWAPLPERVPLHYGASGKADRWGGPGAAHLLVVVAVVTHVFVLVLTRYHHLFNYPVEITAENAQVQYRLARQLLFAVANVVTAIFLYVYLATWRVAAGLQQGLSPWFLLIALGAVLATIGWYLMAARRSR